jgi:HAD superfamily hydrolase (TIGR01458 family)
MIKGVLLDLGGVFYVGNELLPGADEAVQALDDAGIPFRFVTNTSRRSRRKLVEKLSAIGFRTTAEQIFTAPLAVRHYLEKNRLRPFLIVHPDLEEEFAGLPQEDPDAVVLGDAGEAFCYDRLNTAFRLLMEGAPLLCVGVNRYFREPEGLSLDAGPFVRALEFATATEAQVLGKPAAGFFLDAVADLGCRPHEAVMVGDDVESDVGGALAAGLQGMLVRTGKYRPGDEEAIGEGGGVAADIGEAVARILAERERP